MGGAVSVLACAVSCWHSPGRLPWLGSALLSNRRLAAPAYTGTGVYHEYSVPISVYHGHTNSPPTGLGYPGQRLGLAAEPRNEWGHYTTARLLEPCSLNG